MVMTTDNWITVSGIAIQLIIAIVSIVITSQQVKSGKKENRLLLIRGLLDTFRAITCDYWGKTALSHEQQLELENKIKSCKQDIAIHLKYLYDNCGSVKNKIYDLTSQFNEVYELATGSCFETSLRKQDRDKCEKIIESITKIKMTLDQI